MNSGLGHGIGKFGLYLDLILWVGTRVLTISERHLCAKQCSDQCVSKPPRPNCGQSSILAPVSAFDAVFTQDLNENLSEMSLVSHPWQYIEPKAFLCK